MKELTARPICDRCNKPVEQFVEAFDDFAQRVIYVARCHGESERVDIDVKTIEAARKWDPQFGRAFLRLKELTA